MAVAVSSVGVSSPVFFVSLSNTMLIRRFAGASGLSGSIGSLSAIPTTVSYTHLRAHET